MIDNIETKELKNSDTDTDSDHNQILKEVDKNIFSTYNFKFFNRVEESNFMDFDLFKTISERKVYITRKQRKKRKTRNEKIKKTIYI